MRAGRKRKVLFRVGERDGWVCHVCGKPVDPELYWKAMETAAGPDRLRITALAPSLDHLNDANGLEEANLRITHRRCNERRGPAVPI